MYELISDLTRPFTFFQLLALAATLNLWRKRTERRTRLLWVTIPVIVVTLLSMPAVGYISMGSMERNYPPLTERPSADAIVVLSSGGGYSELHNGPLLAADTVLRTLLAGELYDQGPPCPVILSGGPGDESGPAVAEGMYKLLASRGVAEADMIREVRSRTTHENAVFTSIICRERGIQSVILVTDAMHLPRSVRSFEAQGIEVVGAGCQYVATGFKPNVWDFLPGPQGAIRTSRATRELRGLLFYWLTGKIDLFRSRDRGLPLGAT